jgi:plasmid stabilization system protein ParE
MSGQIILAPEAKQDFDKIVDCIAKDNHRIDGDPRAVSAHFEIIATALATARPSTNSAFQPVC